MSRGGSDISGSILARCIQADLYENWTDVSGFLMADPRIVENPRNIEQITFSELRELSYMGASVLHEDAVFPLRERNIPIQVLNTNRPQDLGTIVRDKIPADPTAPLVTGIAGKKDFVSIEISKKNMSNRVGFVREVLSILESYNVSVEHLPSGIDSFSVVVAKAFSADAEHRVADVDDVAEDEMILDVGPKTAAILADILKSAGTIVWNGPVGVFEMAPYAEGTRVMADAIAEATDKGAFSIAGGGDTVSAVHQFGIAQAGGIGLGCIQN